MSLPAPVPASSIQHTNTHPQQLMWACICWIAYRPEAYSNGFICYFRRFYIQMRACVRVCVCAVSRLRQASLSAEKVIFFIFHSVFLHLSFFVSFVILQDDTSSDSLEILLHTATATKGWSHRDKISDGGIVLCIVLVNGLQPCSIPNRHDSNANRGLSWLFVME